MSKLLFFNIAGPRKLQEDSFSILICQVEDILNSRPLTSLSSDTRDVDNLKPGHFLTGMPSDTTISSNHIVTGNLCNNVNSIKNEFRTNLLNEYLPTLRQRWNWNTTVEGIKVGGMVWILENQTPRGIWSVVRVQKINKGMVNVVMSCLVRKSRDDFVKTSY